MTTIHSAPAQQIPDEPPPAYAPNTPVRRDPAWEAPAENARKTPRVRLGAVSTSWALSDRFDRMMPPHKKYLRLSRRNFLIILAVALVFIIGLAIGLAVGLHHPGGPQDLPLPDGHETYTGDLTYYEPGLGACGVTSTNNDAIVSVSHIIFDAAQKGSDPNQNPLCGLKIRAQREKDGKMVSQDLTVVDRCTGCQPTDLDITVNYFAKLADVDEGRVNVTWAWL